MPEPCLVWGHHAWDATKCTPCRSEWIETGTWPHGTQHHEAARTPAGPDARERAAGRREDEDR